MGGEIVITGGNGGLARAISAAFAEAGHRVSAPARDALDVTDAPAVKSWFAGRDIALLVCNAGLTRDTPLAKLGETAWDETLDANLKGAALCAAAAAKGMVRARDGHIVFVSSHSAIHPPAGQAAYAAAKAGLIGLCHSLARELGPANVRVNAILPGFLETPMTAGVSPGRRETVLRDHALGRFNTPEAAAAFLLHLHERMPHTSGQVFRLDSRVG